jgi:hypothetical protein
MLHQEYNDVAWPTWPNKAKALHYDEYTTLLYRESQAESQIQREGKYFQEASGNACYRQDQPAAKQHRQGQPLSQLQVNPSPQQCAKEARLAEGSISEEYRNKAATQCVWGSFQAQRQHQTGDGESGQDPDGADLFHGYQHDDSVLASNDGPILMDDRQMMDAQRKLPQRIKPDDNAEPAQEYPEFPLAHKIPRWMWTFAECQAWLKDFFTRQFGRTEEYAHQVATAFEGMGANLYLMDFEDWVRFTTVSEANALWATLVSYRRELGAVPEELEIIDQYEEIHEKRGKEKLEEYVL